MVNLLRYLGSFLITVLFCSSVIAQTSIYSGPERNGFDGEGSVGFSRRHGSSIVKTQDSVLVSILVDDIGLDCRTFYSNDGGATWTSMDATTFGAGNYFKYSINIDASDTVYIGGASDDGSPNIIRSWHDGTWYGFDTLGTNTYGVPFVFRSADTLGNTISVSS